MNHQKHYDALVERARNRVLSGYKESHHVIPRCMGGGNEKSNLVDLTPEEHYVAHQLLTHLHPDNHRLAFAARAMTLKSSLNIGRNNKAFGWVRRRAMAALAQFRSTPEFKAALSETLRNSERLKLHHASIKGIPRTDEVRRNLSDAHKISEKAAAARAAMNLRKVGRPRSEETRKKLREVQIGKVLTDEHKANIGEGLKGRKLSDSHVANMSAARMGKPGTRLGAVTSEETKAKMRAAALGRRHSAEVLARISATKAAKTQEERSAVAHKAWATKRAKLAQTTE